MQIGSVKLENKTVLAPLAGITNLPFRLIARMGGSGLVCSEMVSSNALAYKNQKTMDMLISSPDEKPVSMQIFGADPSMMAEAAAMVEESGADIVDINCGCSVRKILKSGSGSALMKTPETAEKVFRAVRDAVKIPLTVKFRTGWDRTGDHAVAFARIAEDAGVDAVAVHPRTATQGFGGVPDRSVIKRVKETVSIPVIGNGDITTPEEGISMFEETGCDGIMIGRAAMANPMIFSQINALLSGEEMPERDLSVHFDIMLHYLRSSVEYLGEFKACTMMRSRLCWFVKGLRGASAFRESIKKIETEAEAVSLIQGYRKTLAEYEADESKLLQARP